MDTRKRTRRLWTTGSSPRLARRLARGRAQRRASEPRGDFIEAGGIRAALTLVEEYPDGDAFFVVSDLMASGATLALAERGLRVPQDVAIVGFDNSRYATRGEIGLTTI